jgi:DNA primase
MEMSHFKQLVKNVKPSANGYTACCPAHKDKRPSLSFSENEDGKIMVYCHSGCTFSQIIQSLGITAKDLITSNAPKSYSSNSINIKVATPNPSAVVKSKLHTKNKVQRQIEATYKYYDENNILVYESIKYKPKQFSFRRPDHNKKGQYIYNLINTKLYLYQLVPLISAVKNNQTIHIVEGEKDVDNLMEIGLVATTNPMGASIPKQRSKWLEDFNQYFKGANEVIIIPDNDAVGYNHVINIYNNLTGLIKNIKFGIF